MANNFTEIASLRDTRTAEQNVDPPSRSGSAFYKIASKLYTRAPDPTTLSPNFLEPSRSPRKRATTKRVDWLYDIVSTRHKETVNTRGCLQEDEGLDNAASGEKMRIKRKAVHFAIAR